MVLILIMEDGDEMKFDGGDKVSALTYAIGNLNVARIVVGDIGKSDVLWEKQFEPVTVMPSSFGKPRK